MKKNYSFLTSLGPVLRRVVIRHHAEHSRLNDDEWNVIRDLFPVDRQGRRSRDPRKTADGVLLMTKSLDVRWRDVPACYGPWQTIYWRFRRYKQDGTLDEMVARLTRIRTKKTGAG